MPETTKPPSTPQTERTKRQDLMATCAEATEAELRAAISRLAPNDQTVTLLRPAETGMVMLRGRIGGTGAPFNVGEATVTRAVVRLSTGEVGHSYVLGRCPEKARLAAIVDAMGQRAELAAGLNEVLVAPVGRRLHETRAATQAATAKTRVDFFTVARGED